MKQLVLRNFDDLVTVFPDMSLCQIIRLYKQIQNSIKNIELQLSICNVPRRREELNRDLIDHLKADAFLGTYLAKYFCRVNGY